MKARLSRDLADCRISCLVIGPIPCKPLLMHMYQYDALVLKTDKRHHSAKVGLKGSEGLKGFFWGGPMAVSQEPRCFVRGMALYGLGVGVGGARFGDGLFFFT